MKDNNFLMAYFTPLREAVDPPYTGGVYWAREAPVHRYGRIYGCLRCGQELPFVENGQELRETALEHRCPPLFSGQPEGTSPLVVQP